MAWAGLNTAWVVQFLRFRPPGVWDYGPAFDAVLAGLPVARGDKVPFFPSLFPEGELFGEHNLGWDPFDVGSGRFGRLVSFSNSTSAPWGVTGVLPNGAPLVLTATWLATESPHGAPLLAARVADLAALVRTRWGHLGYQLRMTSAKRATNHPGTNRSYHKYGRGVDLSLADANGNKLIVPGTPQARHLDRLSRLAVEAGFDFVWHERGDGSVALDHLHATVHTGGPSVTIDDVGPGTTVAGTNTREWQVTVTVADPDGVWQVFVEVTSPLSPATINWSTASSFLPKHELEGAEIPPLARQVTFTVSAANALLNNGQGLLHVWARDSFGSVAINLAQAAPRTPQTTTQVIHAFDSPPGMKPIAAGSFSMGSNAAPGAPYYSQPYERPVHQVTITRPFWMGEHEVTQAKYQALMGSNPSNFQSASWPNSSNRPVERVTWYNAMAYCAALTAQAAAAGQLPLGYQYRLPTEAEWEYCCRAGTTTEFHYGNSLFCGQANFSYSFHSSSSCLTSSTALVGHYAPNPWGLFDMHGNVIEWCLDSWDGSANYPSAAVTDPYVNSGPGRVFRGGSWGSFSCFCRSAYRSWSNPSRWGSNLGFRVVLAPVLV